MADFRSPCAAQPVGAGSGSSTGATLRRILTLAGPTTALSALQVAAQLIETALAARQGTAALAGWAVLLPFVLLMQQMSAGAMGGGVVSAIARALGAGRRDEASALVLHAIVIATGLGLVFALGLGLFAAPLLEAVAGAQAAHAATVYAFWMFGVGALATWLTNTLASILRGAGRHALAARTLFAIWLVYPPLAWALAEPLGMGLAGVGAAFAAASWIATAAMAWVIRAGALGFVPVPGLRLSAALFKRILGVGALACLLAAIANLTTILVTAQLREHGTAVVAAYGIAARMEFLMVPLAFGIGSALTALVGGAVGAGDWRDARRIAWTGAWLAFVVTASIGITAALVPLRLATLFTADPQVAAVAAQALGIIGPGFGAFGLGLALYFASMGAGRMAWPFAASLARFGLAVGGGWCLANLAGLGLAGNFIGVALGITAYGVVTACGVRSGVWQGSTKR